MKQAIGIRDRAIRRAGELLKQIEPGQSARDGKRGADDHTPFNRGDAARDAGMSKHQQVQAIRVANVELPLSRGGRRSPIRFGPASS
jgi:hypothetical protein